MNITTKYNINIPFINAREEIRTLEPFSMTTSLAVKLLNPLGHPSMAKGGRLERPRRSSRLLAVFRTAALPIRLSPPYNRDY